MLFTGLEGDRGFTERHRRRREEAQMRILMLGWEFPPFIAGGLGTACYGLTKALDRLGHEILFVLPKPVDRSLASHIRLVSPESARPPADLGTPRAGAGGWGGGGAGVGEGMSEIAGEAARLRAAWEWLGVSDSYTLPGFEHVEFHGIPAGFSSPYRPFAGRRSSRWFGVQGSAGEAPGDEDLGETESVIAGVPVLAGAVHEPGAGGGPGPAPAVGSGYEGDMIQNAERYARLVVALARRERFDVIHAHDWMTFPAGEAMARASGKPLVVHVHSTEFDRAGEHPNQRVYDIERRGMHAALRVLAVSHLTRSICVHRYGVPTEKIGVVWNGVDAESAQPRTGESISAKDKIVLFLGRITMQKGPEYFVRAAKRVLEKMENVRFVMAGSGDMAMPMIEEAAALGIGHRFTFTGFLRGRDVDRVYQMADCYVMPSVSEPFGIAPLEAMRNDVPVIISKQSGVSEALTHVLKVDFWDIDEMANKIVAILRHPPLGQTLRSHGAFELRKLTWEGAAQKCVEAYAMAVGAQGR
jgi:glycosyltransferase involved in cell wall biosynthesis